MFRAAVLYQHRDDYVDNTFAGVSADGTKTPQKNAMGGFSEKDARMQVLAKPNDKLSVLVSAHAREYAGTSTLFLRQALTKGSNKSAAPRDQVAFDEANNNPQAYDTQGISAHVDYDFGPVTLTSISAYEHTSGYSRGDTDGGAAANFPVGGVPNGFGQSQGRVHDLDQLTQEIRLASNGEGKLKWQVGGLYFDSRDNTEFAQRGVFLLPTSAGYNPNNFVLLNNLNTSWAVFGQVSYQLTDALTITGGLRDTYDAKKTVLVKTSNNAANVSSYTGRRYVRLADEQVSWDLSANYQINPDVSVYARAAKGFRGPTIQGRSAVFNADFTTADSESILSYEAGFKSTLLDNTLRFNASAFTYEVKDIQLNGNDSNGNGVLFNADKAEAYGVEADLEWRPVQQPAADGRRQLPAQRDQRQARLRAGLRPERHRGLHGRKPDDQGGRQHLRPDRRPAAAERPEVQPELHGPLRHPGRRRRPRVRVHGLERPGLHELRALQDQGVLLEGQLRRRPEAGLREPGQGLREWPCSAATSPTRRTSRA
jgi:iron complex outermembrane receptor protein